MATATKFLFSMSLAAVLGFGLAVTLPALGNEHGSHRADSADPSPATSSSLAPTAVPGNAPSAVSIQNLGFTPSKGGVSVWVGASGPLHGRVSILKNSDRILVVFPNTVLLRRKVAKDYGKGALLRGRLAQHPDGSVWLVLDLKEPVKYKIQTGLARGYGLSLIGGAAGMAPTPAPTPVAVAPAATNSPGLAHLPKINLMFFDTNVMFQGKQYERFPCANFTYEKTDQFPLKREFVTTLVFYDGYGAFVGNLRVIDPKGNVIWHTQEPFAFNLFNKLFDYFTEVPCKLEFPERGYYALILTLNSEDVHEQDFYVGYSDDQPEKAIKK